MTAARVLLAGSGWIALPAAVVLPAASPLRLFLVVTFLCLCPGLASMRWTRRTGDRAGRGLAGVLEAGVLSVVLSLSVSTLVAVLLFLSGLYSVEAALVVLAALTSAATLLSRSGGVRVRPEARAEGTAPSPGAEKPDS